MVGSGSDASWLPARVEPVRGEAFDSFCRRLADANDLTASALKRICRTRYPEARGTLDAVARSVGVGTAVLRSASLSQVGAAYKNDRLRLKTIEWLCRSCRANGIRDELNGLCIQFLCLLSADMKNCPQADMKVPVRGQ